VGATLQLQLVSAADGLVARQRALDHVEEQCGLCG
jgi:hypothetical protein